MSQIRFCVIIAAGLSILISCSSPDPQTQPKPADISQVDTVQSLDDWYANPEYDFALRLPASWVLVEEPLPGREHKAVNLFKKEIEANPELPLDVHAKPEYSYIAIWPRGVGTELPAGPHAFFEQAQNVPALSFEVDTAKSKVLLLSDDTIWSYFIVPEDPPESWSDSGFIFAQIQTANHETSCFDEKTGEELPMDECNFLEGDRFVRKGDRNERDAAVMQTILETVSLRDIRKKEAASDMIEVDNPAPGMEISSPLTVKGKAKGYWYNEGIFTIKLYDTATDSLLAKTTAKADGTWMTEQFVPFETTLTFKAPDNQRGRLVFERANPSGLPQNEQSYSVPVILSSR